MLNKANFSIYYYGATFVSQEDIIAMLRYTRNYINEQSELA
jgi:hypothetical protein